MPETGRTLVLASGNAGKLRELREMLHPRGWSVRAQNEWNIDEAVEDGLTFVENALIKARHAALHTGLPALGDDSGLIVDALDGAPGILSARFAGECGDDAANIQRLLEELRGVPDSRRTAHFHCAMVVVRQPRDPIPLVAFGKWRGNILKAPRGTGGFGYDPLFWVPSEDCSAAELDPVLKNRISHRGQAMAKLADQLGHEFGT
jgi:XTP/dITP diphosphohydrolase